MALCNGGAHRESNLAPVLRKPHREKTAQDVRQKAITYRKRAKHLGIAKKKRRISYRRFNGEPVR